MWKILEEGYLDSLLNLACLNMWLNTKLVQQMSEHTCCLEILYIIFLTVSLLLNASEIIEMLVKIQRV